MITDKCTECGRETTSDAWERGYAKGYERALEQFIDLLNFRIGPNPPYGADPLWIMEEVHAVAEKLRKEVLNAS